MRTPVRYAAAALVLVLSACGGSAGASGPSSQGPSSPGAPSQEASLAAPAEEVALTIQADVSDQLTADIWQGLFAKFTEEHPNITVTLVPTESGNRDTNAKTLIASGNFPDVQFALPVGTFKDNMLPYDESDPDIKDQLLNIETQKVGGKLYSLGIDLTPWNTVFYNKTMFSTAGIDAPPKTLDEFNADLAKLQSAGFQPLLGPGEWVPAFTFPEMSNLFSENPCWYGRREAGEVHFTDRNWVTAADQFATWIKNGYFGAGNLGINYDQGNQAFLQGKAAIYLIGSWVVNQFAESKDFEVGYFAMPTKDGQLRLDGSIGSVGYTVSSSSKHPNEAVTLAKWLALTETPLTMILNVFGFGSNVNLKSGPLTSLKTTPLGQAVAADVPKAVSFSTSVNGAGDCNARPGVEAAIGTLVAEPLYLDPNQPVAPLLQALDKFWDDAKPAS